MLGNGWDGGPSFYISNEKKQASFIPTCPPTTYANMRLVDKWRCSQPAVRKTKLKAFSFMLPHCTAHMLKTISLRGSRVKLNVSCFRGGPIVFHRLAGFNFTTSKPPTSILWYATFDIPAFWCGVTCVLKNWNHIT